MYEPANVRGPLNWPLPSGCEEEVYGRGRTSMIVFPSVNGKSRVPRADGWRFLSKSRTTQNTQNGWNTNCCWGNHMTLNALFTFRLGVGINCFDANMKDQLCNRNIDWVDTTFLPYFHRQTSKCLHVNDKETCEPLQPVFLVQRREAHVGMGEWCLLSHDCQSEGLLFYSPLCLEKLGGRSLRVPHHRCLHTHLESWGTGTESRRTCSPMHRERSSPGLTAKPSQTHTMQRSVRLVEDSATPSARRQEPRRWAQGRALTPAAGLGNRLEFVVKLPANEGVFPQRALLTDDTLLLLRPWWLCQRPGDMLVFGAAGSHEVHCSNICSTLTFYKSQTADKTCVVWNVKYILCILIIYIYKKINIYIYILNSINDIGHNYDSW